MTQRKILTLKSKSTHKPIQKPIEKEPQTQPANKEKTKDIATPKTSTSPKEKSLANTKTQTKSHQKQQNWTARRAAAKIYEQYLIQNHPTLFGDKPKPLKIGIHKDLNQTRGPHSHKTMHFFMSRYTQSKTYLQALIKGSSRYDLNGKPAGIVSEQQKQIAQQALEKLESKSQPTKS